jgi:hypothetical protein
MKRWYIPLVVLILALPVLWVINCSGPAPAIRQVRVQPAQEEGGYNVNVTLQNDSPGHGEVQVTATLRDQNTGEVYTQTQNVFVQSGQIAVVTVNVQAPPGSYTPNVQAAYPPG